MTLAAALVGALMQQPPSEAPLALVDQSRTYAPLDRIQFIAQAPGEAEAVDGAGRIYWKGRVERSASFVVAGALGSHVLRVGGASVSFKVDAQTSIQDPKGDWDDLLELLRKSMYAYGGVGARTFNGRPYKHYVPWHLDQALTAKGMKWFDGSQQEFVDLHRQGQRPDGMIWSMTERDNGPGYWDTAYGPLGFAKREGGVQWVRQPVESHPEFYYVHCIWEAFQSTGDKEWMKGQLDSAIKALDYLKNAPYRWSKRFDLVKRVYTIDTWDFQAEDKWLPDSPLAPSMMMFPDRSKFTIFYGDNTGYAWACDRLAVMLDEAGRGAEAAQWRERAKGVMDRINALAWNGSFYTHRIEEDPEVTRDFGVDEKTQVTLSNAYSLNRGLDLERRRAIVKTYMGIRDKMPKGSPGEWYMCFPPYERGFGSHNEKWQYMNGGVSGTVAGELAKGAFESGFEEYGAGVLRRIHDLGKRDKRIAWGWRGAPWPDPIPRQFTPVSLAQAANMDTFGMGGPKALGWAGNSGDNDVRGLPVGSVLLGGIPWEIADPAKNDRRAALALGNGEGRARSASLVLGKKARTLYILSTVSGLSGGIAGLVELVYADGSRHVQTVTAEEQVTGWWFPRLEKPKAGVAWRGPNGKSSDVGLSWAALDNPSPDKEIKEVVLRGPLNQGDWIVAGLTLADQEHPIKRSMDTFGGPDNWPPASCTYGLMEGLAGIHDAGSSMSRVVLSPRWVAAGVEDIQVTARYAGWPGYAAYRFRWVADQKRIQVEAAFSGESMTLRVLLPKSALGAVKGTVNGSPAQPEVEKVGDSRYAVLPIPAPGAALVDLSWD